VLLGLLVLLAALCGQDASFLGWQTGTWDDDE
jgi:hypothetical protein